jgi:hypothetical protein
MRNLIRRSFGNLRLSGAHPALNLYSTPHSIDDTWKFREHAVAGIFDDPTSVLIDLRINQLAKVGLEAFVRPLLIRPHQPRIASHISGKDGSETAGRGHSLAGPLVEGSICLTIAQLADHDMRHEPARA